VLLEHYLNVVGKRIGSSYEALDKKLNQQPAPKSSSPATPAKPVAPTAPDQSEYQDHLLAMAWVHPHLRDSLSKLEPKAFTGKVRQMIAAHLKDLSPLLQSDEITVKINELELIAETKYPVVSDELYFVAADIAKRIKKEYKQTLRAELARQLFATDDAKTRATLNDQVKQLDKEIEALKH
jgi:hypothetical protein